MAWVKSPASVLRDIGISQPSEIDLELIAFTLNAEIVYEPLTGYEANIFGSDEKAVITVNSNSIDTRRRFSLAHEIGHWTNDRGKNLSIECNTSDLRQREDGSSQLNLRQAREARANAFASQILMPTFMLEPIYSHMPISMDAVKSIAEAYNTSLTSSASRLVQITKHPVIVTLWSSDGTRRWFNRSSSLAESIWPRKQIQEPDISFLPSNGALTSDHKWLDENSAQGSHISETVFDNGFDIIALLSWVSSQ